MRRPGSGGAPLPVGRVAALATGIVAFIVGVVLLPDRLWPGSVATLALVTAAALALEVELPWGGNVSLGHPVVIALATLLPMEDFITIVALALLGLTLIRVAGRSEGRELSALVVIAAASAAALLGRAGGDALVGVLSPSHRLAVVTPAVMAGVAYLSVVLVASLGGPRDAARPNWRTALSIHVSLLCAGALLALAGERDPVLGAVVALPLLVLRFSFRRYVEARRTYAQTTQALAMIPEVAGLTPLGHATRTAVYAEALAESLGFSPAEVDLAVTVARLHHIGQIAHPDIAVLPWGLEPADRVRIGDAAADILAETGFLGEVADLVANVHRGAPDLLIPVEAVVRVASTLDDLVGQEPEQLSDALVGLLARHEEGLERTMALALAQLCDRRPTLAKRACAAGEPLAASGPRLGLVLADR